jgi:hypothetical protein
MSCGIPAQPVASLLAGDGPLAVVRPIGGSRPMIDRRSRPPEV